MPSVTPGELKHVQILLLGPAGEQGKPLTLPQLLLAIRESLTVQDAARRSHAATVDPQLARIAQAVRIKAADVEARFRKLDVDGTDRVEMQEVTRLVQQALPQAELHELRFLQAALYELDIERTGFTAWSDLLQASKISGCVMDQASFRKRPRRLTLFLFSFRAAHLGPAATQDRLRKLERAAARGCQSRPPGPTAIIISLTGSKARAARPCTVIISLTGSSRAVASLVHVATYATPRQA